MDPRKEADRAELQTRLKRSWDSLRCFREKRETLIRDYCGSYYGDNTPDQEILMNFMQIAADAICMRLTASRPQVLISTPFRRLETFAKQFQARVNNVITEVRLEETLELIALDAFFGVGISKTYLAPIGPVSWNGTLVDPGKPFVERVSLDDFIFEMGIPRWDQIGFSADGFELHIEDVRANPDYDPEAVAELVVGERSPADNDGERRAREISDSRSDQPAKHREHMVRLMEVYLPRENLVATWQWLRAESKPLQVREYNGPEGGPHDMLCFGDVPDNVMPTGPAQVMKSLHDLWNGLLRKQRNQSRRQKDLPIYSGNAADDAARLKKASDGEWTQVNNVQDIDVLKMGGVDQGNLAFSMTVQGLLNMAGGNIEARAGLGAQTQTVGQDKLIHGAISSHEAKLKQRMLRFTGRIASKLGQYAWNDNVRFDEIQREVDGLDFPVVSVWSPEQREGDFWQYNFAIDTHSQPYRSPEERVQAAMGVLERVIIPMLPHIEQQGGQLDTQEMIESFSEMLNLPRIRHWLRFDGPPLFERPGPASRPPRQAPHTTRTNIRQNIPTGGTQESRRTTMIQALLNGSANDDQMAALSR